MASILGRRGYTYSRFLQVFRQNTNRKCKTLTQEAEPKELNQQNQTELDFEDKHDFLTFDFLLRNSRFMQMGSVNGTRVIGEIIEVHEDDLYIDFGGKFHCVCKRPIRSSIGKYKRGMKVDLVLKDLEMAHSFIGTETPITLLEADAVLLGTAKTEKK